MRFNPAEPTGFVTTTKRLRDGTVVLSVDGDIDLDTAEAFEMSLTNAIGHGTSPVIVDLSECAFIDSSGLRILIAAGQILNGGGPLTLVVANSNILRVFEITSLADEFVIYPTLESAINFGGYAN